MSTSFHLVDYAVLLGSLLISSFIGVFFAYKDRNQQNNTEFLLGSRQMGVGPVCLSLMASFLSAITVLGYPAEVYLRGASLSVSALSSVFATTCAGQLVVPVFYRLQLTSMHTVSDLGETVQRHIYYITRTDKLYANRCLYKMP